MIFAHLFGGHFELFELFCTICERFYKYLHSAKLEQSYSFVLADCLNNLLSGGAMPFVLACTFVCCFAFLCLNIYLPLPRSHGQKYISTCRKVYHNMAGKIINELGCVAQNRAGCKVLVGALCSSGSEEE